jgi:riboflavin synthase
MFTGLIEAVGTLAGRTPRGPGARLVIAAPSSAALSGLALGESISVNGVCLTVDALGEGRFEADASKETLQKTTLGALPLGARLNLERALTLAARLGGHLVSGHVDGTGALVSRGPMGEAERLVFRAPRELMRFVAPKGSIAVDGTSLTVNEVDGDTFSVAIIPRTRKETRIDDLGPGDAVNLEIDLVARYVLRLLEAKEAPSGDAALVELLRKNGYM